MLSRHFKDFVNHSCFVNYVGCYTRFFLVCYRGRNESNFASFPSVCLHSSTHLLLERYSWNSILEAYMKMFPENPYLLKIGQKYGTLYITNQVVFIFNDVCYCKKAPLLKESGITFVMLGEVISYTPNYHSIHRLTLLSSNYPIWSDNLVHFLIQVFLEWSESLSSDHVKLDDCLYCEGCVEKLYNQIVFTTLSRQCCQTSEIANMKQSSFCCLCLNKIHHSILHNCTKGVQLVVALKYSRAVLLLFRRWYCFLKNKKSIRELIMFKVNRWDCRSFIQVIHYYGLKTSVDLKFE